MSCQDEAHRQDAQMLSFCCAFTPPIGPIQGSYYGKGKIFEEFTLINVQKKSIS